jgi:hypothetical protein
MGIFGSRIKRSASEAIKIIHDMLLDKTYKYSELVKDEFRGFECEESYALMNLGRHYAENTPGAFEIIRFLH